MRRLRDRVRPQRLGDPGRLALQHGSRRLRRDVARREPGAAGRQHDVGGRCELRDRRCDLRPPRRGRRGARRHSRPLRAARRAGRRSCRRHQAARDAVGDGQHGRPSLLHLLERARPRTSSPCRSPSPCRRPSARRPTPPSAPPSRRRSARSSRPSRGSRPLPSATSSVTATCVSGSGWQSGISSDVRFAAMIPASCAVASASPFGSSRSCAAVSGAILHDRPRDGATALHRLGADVDHPHGARLVDVREVAHSPAPACAKVTSRRRRGRRAGRVDPGGDVVLAHVRPQSPRRGAGARPPASSARRGAPRPDPRRRTG